MAILNKHLNEIRNDYHYILKNYGDVRDFTGSGMEVAQLQDLLMNPTKRTAFECYKDRIESMFEKGCEGDMFGKLPRKLELDIHSDDRLLLIHSKLKHGSYGCA